MSDTETTILALKLRERDLELEACAVKARVEEVRNMLELLERPRRGRPRNVQAINPVRQELGTAVANPEPEPENAA